MLEKKPFIISWCDRIIKSSIYALVFLMPLLFLPWTTDVLDFNKQALFIVLIFVAMFAWMIKTLTSRTLEVNTNRVYIIAGVLFLTSLVSTIFSVLKYGSFWGWPASTSESLLSLICLFVLYFLVGNTFSEREIKTSFLVLTCSALVVEIFGILQLCNIYILPFDFARTNAFNTVGSAGSLGLFLAALLPLCIMFLIQGRGWKKVLYGANVVLIFVALLMINYHFIWWVVLVGSALMMAFWMMRRDIFDGKWIFLPMFFFIIALFFIAFTPLIRFIPQSPSEIYLSNGATFSIDASAIKSFPIFGSGLGSFVYDFVKYKNPNFNNTSLWNVQFNEGISKFFTAIATTGILGILALIAFIAFPLFYGVRLLLFDKSKHEIRGSFLIFGVSLFLLTETLGYFLYNSNLTLDFIYFFFLAALVSMIFRSSHKTYVLTSASLLNVIVAFLFTLFFIFGCGVLVLEGQRYVADFSYHNAIASFQANDINGGVQKLETAKNLNGGLDLYYRQLAGAYIAQAQATAKSTDGSKDDRTKKIQNMITNAVGVSQVATILNPNDVNNWVARAGVYQNLIGLAKDSDTMALKTYESARALDPSNPYLPFQEGVIYFGQKDYKNADDQLQKAISLKSDYPDVLYLLGLNYDALGQNDKAQDAITKLLALVPQDQATTIQKILDNLKAGRPALDGIGQQPPATAPQPPVTSPDATKTPTTASPNPTTPSTPAPKTKK